MTPGSSVLPSQVIVKLIEKGFIQAVHDHKNIQPASLDLTVGDVAYRVCAGFLPGINNTVNDCLEDFSMHTLDLEHGAVLERGCVYIIPLRERFELPPALSGITNPKSSVGRLDVFVRVITDYGVEFDIVPEQYTGALYAEVSPRAFSIFIKQGVPLTQLRLVVDKEDLLENYVTEDCMAFYNGISENMYKANELPIRSETMCVDLLSHHIIGYKAVKNPKEIIVIDAVSKYNTQDFWIPIEKPKDKFLIIDPEEFYILSSKELISVPPGYSTEMGAYNTSMGEFRSHYAGFFDPNFGYDEPSKIVLELRAHDVPFVIRFDQVVAEVIYTPMLEIPDRLYGRDIKSNYQGQTLRLGKQFKNSSFK